MRFATLLLLLAPAVAPAIARAQPDPPPAPAEPEAPPAPAESEAPPAPAPPPAPPPPPSVTAAQPRPPAWTDNLDVSGGAILWYYQPLTGGSNNVDLFYANLVVDAHDGALGLHIDPRFRGTKLRPYFDGPAWVEEAYAYDRAGPVTIKAGKVYSHLGLFWDDSFYGSVLVYDGLKLAPDYGVSVEGAYAEKARIGAHYWAQYFVVDGRTNVSLPGRDTISIPGARRRNEVIARAEPFVTIGDAGVLTLGASGEVFQADLPEGKDTVVRAGADATFKTERFGVWGEYLRQNGRSVDAFPIAAVPATDTMPATPGAASAHNDYVLVGASYAVGPVTARYNVSVGRYGDLDVSETLHEPAVGWKVGPDLTLLAELVLWHRHAPTGTSTVDDSLDVTLHGHF